MSSRVRNAIIHDAGPSSPEDIDAYAAMLAIRRFEEKLGQLVALGLVSEPGGMAAGKEAVAIAIAKAAKPEDWVSLATGAHALLLARGAEADVLYRRLISGEGLESEADKRATQCAKSNEEALAKAVESSERGVRLCWIEAAPGVESRLAPIFARAARETLPLVCVIEASAETIAGIEAASGLNQAGLAYESVHGIDARRVLAAIRDAAEGARRGRGAAVIMVRSERFQGHAAASMRKPGVKDRPREDWDPIARARARLREGGTSEAALKSIEKSVRESINAAAAEAREDREPVRDAS